MSRVARDRVPRLYAICDLASAPGPDLGEFARRLVDAGVQWLQVRAKAVADLELFRVVERVFERTAGYDVEIWINDRPDLALLFPARGVHLGQEDLPPEAARAVLGPDRWIGWSTHSLEQVVSASADAAVDVVAVGPVFPTSSKARPDPVVGLELVKAARGCTEKPLVAIGGIDLERAPAVIEAGADAVAVISALYTGQNPSAAVRALVSGLKALE